MSKVHVVNLGKLFLFQTWRVVKFLIAKLSRCKKVDLKSDTLLKISIEKLARRKNFISESDKKKKF